MPIQQDVRSRIARRETSMLYVRGEIPTGWTPTRITWVDSWAFIAAKTFKTVYAVSLKEGKSLWHETEWSEANGQRHWMGREPCSSCHNSPHNQPPLLPCPPLLLTDLCVHRTGKKPTWLVNNVLHSEINWPVFGDFAFSTDLHAISTNHVCMHSWTALLLLPSKHQHEDLVWKRPHKLPTITLSTIKVWAKHHRVNLQVL